MARTLVEYGDRAEQLFGHYLAPHFPAYEEFWSEFIVPLTGRPDSIRLRDGLDPLLAKMAETHYSVFRHLIAAHRLLGVAGAAPQDAEELYDAVFLYVGAATEMVDDFLVVWARIRAHVGQLAALPGFDSLEASEQAGQLAEYMQSQKYEQDRQAFLEGARPVTYPLHSEDQIITQLLEAAQGSALQAWSRFEASKSEVRHYRNTVAHHPIMGKLLTDKGAVLYPRERRLSELDTWQKVVGCDDIGQFDYPATIAGGFLREVEESLNALWTALIPCWRAVASQERYREMIPSLEPTTAARPAAVAYTGYRECSVGRIGEAEPYGPQGASDSSPQDTAGSDVFRKPRQLEPDS